MKHISASRPATWNIGVMDGRRSKYQYCAWRKVGFILAPPHPLPANKIIRKGSLSSWEGLVNVVHPSCMTQTQLVLLRVSVLYVCTAIIIICRGRGCRRGPPVQCFGHKHVDPNSSFPFLFKQNLRLSKCIGARLAPDTTFHCAIP